MTTTTKVEPQFAFDFVSLPDALIDVCLADDVHVLEEFLRAGGVEHVNSFGRYERTPLMLSAAWNASHSVGLLLRRGANVYMKDPDGNTALHLAAENNAKKSLAALIHGHALLDDQNDLGYTALHIAAAEGFVACTKDLLVAGANMSLTTFETNYTPLDLALKEGHQAIVLLLRSWDPSWSNRRNPNVSVMQTWSCQQVADFLRKLGMSQYVPRFVDNCVDGLMLSEMTEDMLENQLKIDRPKHRVRLMEAILFELIHYDGMCIGMDDKTNESTTKILPPVSPTKRRQGPSPYLVGTTKLK